MSFFVYDPIDSDFIHFKTEAEAKAFCEKRMGEEQVEAAGDGWREEVGGLCWGQIWEQAEITKETHKPTDRPLTEDEEAEFGSFDSMIEYTLVSQRSGALND